MKWVLRSYLIQSSNTVFVWSFYQKNTARLSKAEGFLLSWTSRTINIIWANHLQLLLNLTLPETCSLQCVVQVTMWHSALYYTISLPPPPTAYILAHSASYTLSWVPLSVHNLHTNSSWCFFFSLGQCFSSNMMWQIGNFSQYAPLVRTRDRRWSFSCP